MAAKSAVWTSGETGAGALAFCYTRNAKGLREPEEGVLDAVRIVLVSDKLQAFYVRGSHVGGGFSPKEQRTRVFICFVKAFMERLLYFHFFPLHTSYVPVRASNY